MSKAVSHEEFDPTFHVWAIRGLGRKVSIPATPTGWLGFQERRACRKRGGHFFHSSVYGYSARCCQCGARTERIPVRNGHFCRADDTPPPLNDGKPFSLDLPLGNASITAEWKP